MHWFVYKDNIHPSSLSLCQGGHKLKATSIILCQFLELFSRLKSCCANVCANVKRSQSGMKKIPAPLTACIWVWLIFFFLKLFLVFQYGAQVHVPFSRKLIQPLTGFSVRSLRKYFQLEVFAWGIFFFYLFCPVLGISYRCFSYFGWKGY